MLVKDEFGDLVPLVDLQGKFRPEMGEFQKSLLKMNIMIQKISLKNLLMLRLPLLN